MFNYLLIIYKKTKLRCFWCLVYRVQFTPLEYLEGVARAVRSSSESPRARRKEEVGGEEFRRARVDFRNFQNCVSNFAGNGFEPCCKDTPISNFRTFSRPIRQHIAPQSRSKKNWRFP